MTGWQMLLSSAVWFVIGAIFGAAWFRDFRKGR